MNTKPFVSELHDIGKLVDRQALNKVGIKIRSHTFCDFDFSQLGISQPSSPSWYAQFSGKIKSLSSKIPVPKKYQPDVFLTKIADELASSISRTWAGSEDFNKRKGRSEFVQEGIHLLWRPVFYEKEKKAEKKWAAFDTPDEFKRMFKFIDHCKSYDEFFEGFKENLSLAPEDKSVPFNIVSLLTHLELTGKIYRVLKKHCQVVEKNDKLYLRYLNEDVHNPNEAAGGRINEPKQKGKWIYRLIFCKIEFPQSFSRLQDLNVLKKRTNLIKNFSEDENTKDYVLFFTDDFMCLFIPKEDELKIQEVLEAFLKAGFIIDYREMEAELYLLTSSVERAYQEFHSLETNRHLKLYERRVPLDSPPKIQPQLCDSCQMRRGKERFKSQVHEYLCDACYEIREMGDPAREYAEWEGQAAWMKFTLDQDQLSNIIHRLFEEYVDNSQVLDKVNENDKKELKESFRPLAVQMDFVREYKTLLQNFKEKIYEIEDKKGNPFFTEENFLYPIENYNEFGIFKINSEEAVIKVLNIFTSLFKEWFPRCLENSPIKLSISIANVKYPYQEHWRFLSLPKKIINIQNPMIRLSIDIDQYKTLEEKIKGEDIRLGHFLHRLADIEIETKSDTIVLIEIFNNRKNFPALLELIQSGISVRQVLDFYKLTRGVAVL